MVDPSVRIFYRLQGLPPKYRPTKERREGETMDQPITTDPHIEGIPVTKSGEDYSSFENPSTPTPVVVQQPSSCDSIFHFPLEGYSRA